MQNSDCVVIQIQNKICCGLGVPVKEVINSTNSNRNIRIVGYLVYISIYIVQ